MIDLKWIKDCIVYNSYYLSKHGDLERQNEDISIQELEEAICNSIIIEHYEDTGRGESCLIGGYTLAGKPVHIVCGKRGNELIIITVYIPKPPKFKSIYERG